MKRKRYWYNTIILTSLTVYVAAIVVAFCLIDRYIADKNVRLRNEISSSIEKAFGGKNRLIDVSYSGYDVGYLPTSIPKKPDADFSELDNLLLSTPTKEWEDYFENISKMWRIKYKRSDRNNPYEYEDGWRLCVMKYDYEGVSLTWLFPYAVGYFESDSFWGYEFYPSVPTAVQEAFKFYTEDEESDMKADYEKGCIDKAWSKFVTHNKYYMLREDSIPRNHLAGTPLFVESTPKPNNYKHPLQNGYVSNGYYKVYIGSTQPKTWTIVKYKGQPDVKEQKKLCLWWSIGITVCLLCILIPTCIAKSRHDKIKEESAYDKLKRLCNPANFMDNYDKEKLDMANDIYKRILETSPEENDKLNILLTEAENRLGVSVVDPEKIEELKNKVNPQNYMNPYNAGKVALANELFSKLNKDKISYMELSEIEKLSTTL